VAASSRCACCIRRHCFHGCRFSPGRPAFVKDAGFAGVAEGGRFAILDKARPPGTLAAKKAMAQYQ
jgi:hypothetical protein